jgi:organic radical activating enzyme
LKVLPQLPFLETMITQVCNLSCQGCTNFSDLRHTGYVTWSQGSAWIESWLSRISIPDFGIMGGEPMINPEWQDWVQGVRDLMPNAQIRFTTNGLLLHKHPEIMDFFEHIGNTVFKITVHVSDPDLEQKIKQIQSSKDWNPVQEYGIQRWVTKNNLRLQINRPSVFYQTYQGTLDSMRPHNSDPKQAFEICVQKTCPLLYQGRIYKCSTSALTLEILKRHHNPYMQQWLPYQDLGLDAECSSQALEQFVNNFGQVNRICGQCPSKTHVHSKLDHLSTVQFK